MPESLATWCGSSPASHAAWMMPLVMALCPQPGLHVEQAGHEPALAPRLAECFERALAARRIVVGGELLEHDARAVGHLDLAHRAGLVVDLDILEVGHEVDVVQRRVVLLDRGVGLGRALVVGEGHAGTHHVEHRGAAMGKRGLEQRPQLLLVARERARHEAAAELDRDRAQVDGHEIVLLARLGGAADVGGGRELALREPVDAVVLDDVDHRHVAADEVAELSEPDARGVAVARDADEQQLAVRDPHAGGDAGHATVHGVESVGVTEKIGRRLAGATDARELGDPRGLERGFERGLDDAGGDGVVPAARTQRGLGAVVIGAREADAVLGTARRARRGLTHRVTPCATGWRLGLAPAARSWLTISSVTKRASSGMPVKWRTEPTRPASVGSSSRTSSAI